MSWDSTQPMVGRGTLGCIDYSECLPGPPALPYGSRTMNMRLILATVKTTEVTVTRKPSAGKDMKVNAVVLF